MNKKKKIVRLIRYINIGVFPREIMFCVGFTPEQIIEHLKKHKEKEWIQGIENNIDFIKKSIYCACSQQIIDTKTERPIKRLYYLIFTEPFMFEDGSYTILAHEVLHVVQFALKDVLDITEEYEAFAYTHSFVMNKCLAYIRKAIK
jgi:hypothetical protein